MRMRKDDHLPDDLDVHPVRFCLSQIPNIQRLSVEDHTRPSRRRQCPIIISLTLSNTTPQNWNLH